MNLKTVKNHAQQGGVGINGVKTKIIRDTELKGKGIYGYAHPNGKQIDLYPDAFSSSENLIRTLGHERTHIHQFRNIGPATDTIIGNLYEEAAYASENSFIQFWKTGVK